ncbi:MAG: hemerythrin domain-containing protein [Thiomonas arsenitoxydans]|nr:hemerythrin domain-containing protein [Thiomonas arsenitoxydans]
MVTDNAPITNFSHCHDGILGQLKAMTSLPELAAAAERARVQAESLRRFIRDVVLEHHQEEERALFEAVLASAQEGAELAHVKASTDQLTREHRQVEAQFAKLEPELKKMAKGQPCQLDTAAVQALVAQYQAHAEYEEREFLPLSQVILSRNSNHMAALGLTLHMRHISQAPSPT